MNITNKQLISLVEGVKQKDTKSIEFLYNEFYGEIYYICYKILGNTEDAKDIAQETFVEAFVSIDNLKEPLSYKAWISRIATNKSLNFLKHYNRLNIQNVDFLEQLSEIEDIQPQPEEVIIESDIKDTLEGIMNRLPEEQRITLFLFYYQEMTTKEIAELYGCPESTVKSRLTYARKFMRKEVEMMEDKGYKLRCLTALPFIFALFRAEQSATEIIGQGNIINNLNAYIASVPNKPQIGNSATSSYSGVKTGSIVMSGTTKAIIITASALVVATGAIWAGIAISQNSKIQQSSQNSIISEVTSNRSTVSDSIGNEESINSSSEISDTYIKWKYRKVENPTFNDSTYTEVMPYQNKSDLSDELKNKKENLVNPSFTINMDKAKEIIKNNSMIIDEFEFADVRTEQQYPDTENTITIYEFENEIAGFKKGTKEDKTYIFNRNLYLRARQTYSGYTAPNYYKFHIETDTMSQDDIFNLVKEIFGEKLAEWAVYSQTDKEIGEDSENSYSVEINTPNSNGTYILERTVSKKSEEKSLCFEFSIDFKDSNTNLGDAKNYHSCGYDIGYKPIKTNLSLDNMMSTDVGGTDLYNPDEFFNKALDSTGDNTFVCTVLKDVFIETIKYEDGSEYEYYKVIGGPGVDRDGEIVHYTSDEFELYIGVIKNKDGSISIKSFDCTLPTGKIYDDETGLKEDDMQKLLSWEIKKVHQIFGIPESELKDELVHDNIYAILSYTKQADIKLFDQPITVDITFNVYEIGESEVVIEYLNY